MKLAIVGTRNPGVTYQEWEKLLLNKINPDEIQMVISGGAKGVDTFAKLFAARHHKPYMEFAPQYDVYGRYATLKRNTQDRNLAWRSCQFLDFIKCQILFLDLFPFDFF